MDTLYLHRTTLAMTMLTILATMIAFTDGDTHTSFGIGAPEFNFSQFDGKLVMNVFFVVCGVAAGLYL